MMNPSVPPDAGRSPSGRGQPSPPRAPSGPAWPRRLTHAALASAALLVIPVTLGSVFALATGVEGNPDNVLLAALLLAFWTGLTVLHLWLGRHAGPEDDS